MKTNKQIIEAINYYGHATEKELKLMIGDVCEYLDGKNIEYDYYNEQYKRAYLMVLETACAETQLGTFPDLTNKSGFGICQFDEIGFKHVKERSMKYQDEIYNKWGINIDLITLIELRYNPFISVLFCRLFYKSIPDPIPSDRKGRAHYWKKWYNTFKGKGTIKHYLASCEEILDNACI